MNKFQNVNFRSFEDFFDYLPENEAVIVEQLRDLIIASIPEVKEKLSFNVPFFSKHRTICFVWPGSVPWGGIREGVQLGFTQGHLLSDEDGYLNAGNRKYVRIRTFNDLSDIDHSLVRSLLFEATLIDEEYRKAAKVRRPKRS
ncbi:MAG: DUF1801 domain-containing protein [Cyclobacteriaceae bacterium]